MARGGGAKGRGTPRRVPRPGGASAAPRVRSSPAPDEDVHEPAVFRLGAIPGATPGRWIDTWRERKPRVQLQLVEIAVADQRDALMSGLVDAALVRLPLDDADLHVIPLYEEQSVAVVAGDSSLTVADELELADLAGEVLITPADAVIVVDVPGAVRPAFAPPADTGEAIATVAAGVGVVIVPMSLARLHHRRDAAYRPLRDAPTSRVALAWPRAATTPHVETFVGIVRGRTANSSR